MEPAMIRYDPVRPLARGGFTLGNMEARIDGDWVYYSDYVKLAKQLEKCSKSHMDISVKFRTRIESLENDLKECRAALKMITELPAVTANNIAVLALRNTDHAQ
jgi:hypothetical protein